MDEPKEKKEHKIYLKGEGDENAESGDPNHPGTRFMGLKFLALQLFMVIFGVVLFFSLSTLRDSPKQDVTAVLDKDVACAFPQWIDRPLDEQAVKATGRAYRIVLPGARVPPGYDPARVNLYMDETGVIRRIDCR